MLRADNSPADIEAFCNAVEELVGQYRAATALA
jgi:hypothetical protein